MEIDELLKFIEWENDRLRKLYGFNAKQMKHPSMLKIVEEVGELSEQVLKSDNIQRKEKIVDTEKIGHEFADVLITTLLLASTMNIDIKNALEEKIIKIKSRKY